MSNCPAITPPPGTAARMACRRLAGRRRPSRQPCSLRPGPSTRSNFDGTIVNENVNYAAKSDVYLTGGRAMAADSSDDGDVLLRW